MAERNKFGKKEYSDDGTSVTFKFNDGVDLKVNVNDFPPDIVLHLTQHGVGQKLGDSYAKSGVDSPQAARDEVETLIAQLVAGNWRIPSDGAGPKAGLTVRALFRIVERGAGAEKGSDDQKLAARICSALLHIDGPKGTSIQSVRDGWAKQSDELKKTISTSQQVITELGAMKAEEAVKAPSLMA